MHKDKAVVIRLSEIQKRQLIAFAQAQKSTISEVVRQSLIKTKTIANVEAIDFQE